MILGRNFAESQYSEKLYSTGNEELDNLLERAFCEGYELAQREYANKKEEEEADEEKSKKRKKIIRNVAIGTAVTEGTLYGAHKLARHQLKGTKKELNEINDKLGGNNLLENEREELSNRAAKLNSRIKRGEKFTKPGNKVEYAIHRGFDKVTSIFDRKKDKK